MLFDSPFVSLPANTRGRDLVIGDLHGNMPLLRRLLAAASFYPERDRLFSVGDLVHRGPESAAAVLLAETPWFFAVSGNHEVMQLGAWEGKMLRGTSLWRLCRDDGGTELDDDNLSLRLKPILERLPLAIEFPLPDGRRVGIVHAGLRQPFSWLDVQAMTERAPSLYDKGLPGLQYLMLWDRTTAYAAAAVLSPNARNVVASMEPQKLAEFRRASAPVPGIDLLVSGHTSWESGLPLQAGMRLFVDTGASYNGGPLSLVDLASGRFWSAPEDAALPVIEHHDIPMADLSLLWESSSNG